MVTAQYSITPLAQKLGITANSQVVALNPPVNYRSLLGKLPDGTVIVSALNGSQTFIHWFVEHAADLELHFPSIKDHLSSEDILWISWPKKSSRRETDLSEDRIRATALRNGLVDTKVCAVDELWSGLKFVFRLKDR